MIVLFALSFSSCVPVGKPPEKRNFSFVRYVETKDSNLLHSSITEFLKGKGFRIIKDGGVPGKIVTDWIETDSAYYYGSFKREGVRDYCDCGKPDMNWTYERKRAKVIVTTERRDDAFLTLIVATFNTYANYSPCIAVAIRDPEEKITLFKKCESTGLLEEELFKYLESKTKEGVFND